MGKTPYQSTLPELVRKLETNYISGVTTISKYVQFDMLETINTIEAYLNSKHTSGLYDSQGREKPFFNIVTAAVNIWYRATDIDRKNIRVKATKSKDTLDAFVASVHIQEWMRRNNFGVFLNQWGRVLASYGSAVSKFIENDTGLNVSFIPWNRIICDQIDFDNNIKVEVLELTEAQLRKEKGYNKEIVDKLCQTVAARQTLDKHTKDNKNDYIKLYEVHGELPLSYITGKDTDEDTYVQQMHVITFLAKKDNAKEFDDFTLVSGREAKDPYMITHLIEEDGRTLSIGAVEHLFDAQWMMNHSMKAIKDQLDLASKLIFQTADGNFVGQNVLTNLQNGDIMIHADSKPLTKLDNGSHDIASLESFSNQWKGLSNEINGISEAMLGATPPAGSAWRQTEALLQESHSLFEIMTENKALAIEDMLRKHILPYIKKQLKNSDEVAAILEAHDINQIDALYIKSEATRKTNAKVFNSVVNNVPVSAPQQAQMTKSAQEDLRQSLSANGTQRFFKPSDISDKTWAEQFKDLEWELVCDISGEDTPDKEDLATLNTVLQTIATNPRVLIDPNAKMIFNKILTIAGSVSPLQLVDSQPYMPLPSRRFTETMDYPDVPEDIKRQMEASAGFTPSQMGNPPPSAPTVPVSPSDGSRAAPVGALANH